MEDIQYNNKGYYLIGAGGLSRELESWTTKSEFSKNNELLGFIDDNSDVLEKYPSDYKILDSFFNGEIWKGNNVLIGIASPAIKQKFHKILIENKSIILSFIFDNVLVGKFSYLGEGIVCCPNVIISCNVKIGNLVIINSGTQIGHDVVVGDYCSFMANVDIGGNAIIGNNVFIGSNVVILPGVKIPDNTIIGAGSVVIKSIKKAGSYFGNPAVKIF